MHLGSGREARSRHPLVSVTGPSWLPAGPWEAWRPTQALSQTAASAVIRTQVTALPIGGLTSRGTSGQRGSREGHRPAPATHGCLLEGEIVPCVQAGTHRHGQKLLRRILSIPVSSRRAQELHGVSHHADRLAVLLIG